MKRRLRSGAEYPLASMPEDVRNRFSKKPFGMKKTKRVRFDEPEMDGVPVHVSGRGDEATRSLRSDAPKTSEYAYFRKVRNVGIHRGHHHPLYKGKAQLGSSRTEYCLRDNVGASDTHKLSTKDLRFSFSGEKERQSNHCLSHSPLVDESSEPVMLGYVAELTNRSEKSLTSHFENVTPVEQISSPSALPDMSVDTEDKCPGKEIFAAKRHRLRQLATQTIFSDMDNHHPKGSDLVSALLSRLFPKCNIYDDITKADNDNISESLIHKPNNQDKDPPNFCSGRSQEIASLEWNNYASGLPFPSGGLESYVQNKLMDHDQHSKSHLDGISNLQRGFSFCLPFERYRSPGCFHFEGLDEFAPATEYSRAEPCRLLLEWDFQNENNRADLSSDLIQDTAKTIPPRLTTSWNVNQQQLLDNMPSADGLFSSSLLSSCHLGFDSLPTHGSTSHLALDFGLNFDDMRYAVAEPGLFSLVSPITPKSSTLAEDRNTEDILPDINSIFSHRDCHWLKNRIQDGKLQDDFWQNCLAPGEFFAQDSPSMLHPWQFPQYDNSLYSISRLTQTPSELSYPLNDGTFNNSGLSSNFLSSLDAHINLPLLLNHASQDKSNQEIYFDDDDNQLNTDYRYIL